MHGKKIFLTIVSSVMAMSLAAPAVAGCMSMPDGWYVEGNLGSSHLSNRSFPGSSSSSGLGGNVNLGYKFMPFFATEIGYTQYANTSIKDNTSTTAANAKFYSYDLAGKGMIPIAASGFELFGKLGVQRTAAKTTINNSVAANNIGITSSRHSNTGLYIGAGAQYSFMPELAGVVQWARAQNDSNTGTVDLYSVGISFIFS